MIETYQKGHKKYDPDCVNVFGEDLVTPTYQTRGHLLTFINKIASPSEYRVHCVCTVEDTSCQHSRVPTTTQRLKCRMILTLKETRQSVAVQRDGASRLAKKRYPL